MAEYRRCRRSSEDAPSGSQLHPRWASFASQTFSNWKVWVSDDGSRDRTYDILKSYQLKWGQDRLSIQFGNKENFVGNFLSLVCKDSIQADYYAYSDQDDIWEKDKLQQAVNWLQTVPKEIPALYCSRTRLIDADNRDIGFSPLFSSPTSFLNALVQSRHDIQGLLMRLQLLNSLFRNRELWR